MPATASASGSGGGVSVSSSSGSKDEGKELRSVWGEKPALKMGDGSTAVSSSSVAFTRPTSLPAKKALTVTSRCKKMHNKYGVNPGTSWGSLSAASQMCVPLPIFRYIFLTLSLLRSLLMGYFRCSFIWLTCSFCIYLISAVFFTILNCSEWERMSCDTEVLSEDEDNEGGAGSGGRRDAVEGFLAPAPVSALLPVKGNCGEGSRKPFETRYFFFSKTESSLPQSLSSFFCRSCSLIIALLSLSLSTAISI